MTETIAQTLGAKDGLAEHIGERELLLLLDNLEQVIECAPELASLVSSCPNLTLLVTSRELLRVQGEVEYPVPPLAQPEAVTLFCERSQLEPSQEIAELCARLDSLPLAVELAAARTKALTPAQILERLSQRLDLLRGGRDAEARHATLRATIEWSYDLLSESEQRLFARLSVFAGGCTLEASEDMCDADLDTLQSLVEKSLLRFSASEAGSRYWLLETIREYAQERLEDSAEADSLRREQAGWCLALAIRADQEIRGSEQGSWLDRLEAEIDNLRAALSWSLDGSEPEIGLRLCGSLGLFCFYRDYLSELRRWCDKALAQLPAASPDMEAKVLLEAGAAAFFADDIDAAEPLLERSLAAARKAEDPVHVAESLLFLSDVAKDRDAPDQAIELAESALGISREAGDEYGITVALHRLGEHHRDAGDLRRAGDLLSESASRWKEYGNLLDSANSLHSLGDVALDQEDFDRAARLYAESLHVARRFNAGRLKVCCLAGIASVSAARGERSRAARLWGALEMIETAIDVRLLEAERDRYERLTSDACRLHPNALAEGRALRPEAALEYALSSLY